MVETGELGGYPLFDHLKSILDGPIVWTPGLSGAVVVTLRGGDFLLDCGQDVSVGYTTMTPTRSRSTSRRRSRSATSRLKPRSRSPTGRAGAAARSSSAWRGHSALSSRQPSSVRVRFQ